MGATPNVVFRLLISLDALIAGTHRSRDVLSSSADPSLCWMIAAAFVVEYDVINVQLVNIEFTTNSSITQVHGAQLSQTNRWIANIYLAL